MKVIGVREVDYVSKKTQKPVVGLEVYVSYEQRNVQGVCAERLFIGKNYFPEVIERGLSLGDELEVTYNKYGNLASVTIV